MDLKWLSLNGVEQVVESIVAPAWQLWQRSVRLRCALTINGRRAGSAPAPPSASGAG